MKFSASLDTFCKIATASFILLVGVISGFAISNNESMLLSVSVPLLLTVLLFVLYGFAPGGYTVTKDAIIVNTFFRTYVFPKSEILNLRRPTDEEMKWTVRTIGVGGVFGYFGRFHNTKIGRLTMFATQRTNYILFSTVSGQNIVLTPDEPEAFLQAVAS